MDFIRGGVREVAQESITSQMLMDSGVDKPDFVPTIFRLYKDNFMLNYILDIKGQKTRGLSRDKVDLNSNYRTVSSNHIKYRIHETDERVEHFRANGEGVTFTDENGNQLQPGMYNGVVVCYSDTNWLGYKEIAELADGDTQIYSIADPEEDSNGVFKNRVKLISNTKGEYIKPELLGDGVEFKVVGNAHEQDFSERGVEKYEFKSWGDTHLTLMRFKYSWSGTAGAIMKNKKAMVKGRFVEHNGQHLFLGKAEDDMMARASKQINFAHMFGKSTVSIDGKIMMKDAQGREVMMGDGIHNSNGGPIHIPYNGWTKEFLTYFMNEIDQYVNPSQDGYTEVYLGMANMAYSSFQTLMLEYGKTADSNIEGTGSDKGINNTYKYYEFSNIRLIPHKEPSMTNKARMASADGTYANDWDCIVVPLGMAGGNNGIELVQLRPMTGGTVAGVDAGGNIASSVDGSSKHVLFQNGVINQNTIIMLKKFDPRRVK